MSVVLTFSPSSATSFTASYQTALSSSSAYFLSVDDLPFAPAPKRKSLPLM